MGCGRVRTPSAAKLAGTAQEMKAARSMICRVTAATTCNAVKSADEDCGVKAFDVENLADIVNLTSAVRSGMFGCWSFVSLIGDFCVTILERGATRRVGAG